MPKNRKKRRNTPTRQTISPQPLKRKWKDSLPLLKQLSAHTWALMGIAATVIGLISGVMFFSSRVTVSSLSPINQNDPFSTPFSISNDGAFSIYDVKFRCYFKDISFPQGGGFSNFSITDSSLPITTIEAGEKATYKCLLSAPETSAESKADVYVLASYQPKFLPYRLEKPYRFVMQQGSDKQWYWFQQPVAK